MLFAKTGSDSNPNAQVIFVCQPAVLKFKVTCNVALEPGDKGETVQVNPELPTATLPVEAEACTKEALNGSELVTRNARTERYRFAARLPGRSA